MRAAVAHRVRGRRAALLAAVLVAPLLLATACPPPPSPYTVFDGGGRSSTVGTGGCTNCTTISFGVPDGRGHTVTLSLETFDSGSGYEWAAADTYTDFAGTPSFCNYPLVAVRARATLGADTYRMDWDGNEADGRGPYLSVGAPWSIAAGDHATVYVESITLDLRDAPFCIPI
ncbi:MAG: hypothetical protein U0Q22_11305 [Acidimicrobiales bacterium]